MGYLASRQGDYLGGYMGDPGLFGFVKKALGSIAKVGGKIIPGPVGTILGAAGGVLAGRRMTRSLPPPPGGGFPVARKFTGVSVGGPRGINLGIARTQMVQASAQMVPGGDCPKGYHLNKSGYFTSAGYVPPRSRCVRNRRTDYGNTRALRRADRRLKGFVKVAKSALKHTGYTVASKSSRRSTRRDPCCN